jgi:hypothetical protein
MTYLSIVIALQWAAIGYLLFDARGERDRNAGVLADFTKASERERQMLLQRIQAPEVAVMQHDQESRPVPEEGPWLGWDEDPENRLTKDELAEAADGRDG